MYSNIFKYSMYNPHIWSMHSPGNSHALPQGRARVERYRAAAAQAAAEQARRAAGDTASLEMASAAGEATKKKPRDGEQN